MATHATADYLEMPLGLVQAAIAYYGRYSAEIDEWIDLNARDAREAHDACLTGEASIRR